MEVNLINIKNNLLKQLLAVLLLTGGLFFYQGPVKGQSTRFLPLPADFAQISNFQEGVAKVRTIGDSIGYLDTSGHFAIKPRKDFDVAGDFKNGYAWVGKYFGDTLLYGFIDKAGKMVIPCRYKEVEPFYNHLAIVYSDQEGWQAIDTTGNKVMSDSLLITEEPVWEAGEVKSWQDIEPPHFHEGLMLCQKDGKFGYMDATGRLSIDCRYLSANGFTDGVALVALDTVANWFLNNQMDIDRNKNNKNKEDADELSSTLDSLYLNLPSGPPTYKWTLIDPTGATICPIDSSFSPDISRGFIEGLLAFQDRQNKWGFMNTKAKVVIPARFDNEPTRFSDGVCIVQVLGEQSGGKDGYMLLIDLSGKQVAKIPFCTTAGCMYDSNLAYHEGLLAVKINQNWGYMDKQGRLVIRPDFEKALDFHNGRAVVVDQSGQIKVVLNPLRYPAK